jgi:hypothetical protein
MTKARISSGPFFLCRSHGKNASASYWDEPAAQQHWEIEKIARRNDFDASSTVN